MYNNTMIKIQNDTVLISYMHEGNGRSANEPQVPSTVVITLRDFIETIKSSDLKLETPLFSVGTFKYMLEGDIETVYLFSPEQRCTLRYRHDGGVKEYPNALFPSFYITASFNKSNGHFMNGTVRMLKEKYSVLEIDKKITSYRMVFPNVYDGSDRICWGRSLDDVEITIRNCGSLVDIFRTSVFNNDLFHSNLIFLKSVFPTVNGGDDYFTLLTTLDKFPDSYYVER